MATSTSRPTTRTCRAPSRTRSSRRPTWTRRSRACRRRRRSPDPMRTRPVVMLAWEGCQVLDVTGPAEVFSVAAALTGGDAYDVRIASLDGDDVVSTSGVRIGVETAIGDIGGPIDTLLIPGGFTWPEAMLEPQLIAGLRAGAQRSRRVMAVCAGAFIAGAAGLLD